MIRDVTEPASDRFGRRMNYLRVSVTDACNFRCIYCMPESTAFRPREALMTCDELLRLARRFARIGFDKFRLTGGEPTLRDDLEEIVRGMAAIPGVRELAMTTNASRLATRAGALARAGLQRINIRLDTLNPEKFRRMSRGGELKTALDGIAAAEAAGLPIKINAVVVRDWNDGEDVADLARLTLSHPWQVRFLEVMPVGPAAAFQRRSHVSEAELRPLLEAACGRLEPVHPGLGALRTYRLAGAAGTIGFISSVSQPFCGTCARARLTADGQLRLCLLHENEVDLLAAVRAGANDAELDDMIRAGLRLKPRHHELSDGHAPRNRAMSEIGG